MIGNDTLLYLVMAVLADLDEIAIFVTLAQSFIVFVFIPPRTEMTNLELFITGGLGAAVTAIIWQLPRRPAAETALTICVVRTMTKFPIAWVLLRAGAEIRLHRDKKEQLAQEKDDLLVDKDCFVASVSHELRTPLTAVVGLAHTLAEEGSSLTEEDGWASLALVLPTAVSTATRATYDDPATALVAHRAGLR